MPSLSKGNRLLQKKIISSYHTYIQGFIGLYDIYIYIFQEHTLRTQYCFVYHDDNIYHSLCNRTRVNLKN